MQNHAHDSICGCSTDEVHREMETRFLKVNQVLEKLKENLLSTFNSQFSILNSDKQYLQIINLTNYYRNEVIEAELEFPLGPPAEHPSNTPTINKSEINNITLKFVGKDITSEILENHQTCKMIRSKDEVPLLQAFQKIKILFEASVKPFSIVSYEIYPEEKNKEKEKQKGKEGFENQHYKLEINKDGSLNITLKEKNHKFENIHFITIEDDLGDEYSFVPNEKSKVISSKSWKWNIKTIEETVFRKKFLLTTNDLIDIKIEITCYKNSDRIDFKTNVHNTLTNKRIRLHFPTRLQTNYITADTPFGILQRACPPSDWINYADSQPMHNWIDHNNDEFGLAFFGGGLADYELYKDGGGFAITLIRVVGRLSTVKSHSLIETPEAQCNRELEFSYAIYPHTSSREIQDESLIYQIPLITNQSNSMINLEKLIIVSPKLTVSSFKRSEDKENVYILRVFNSNNEELNNCEVSFNFVSKRLYSLNLNEEIISEHDKNKLTFKAEPFQIITFGIEI
jgi:mannosylglycerate hydrolase